MKKKILVALLLSLYGVITANAVCADVILDSTGTTYQCSSPGTFGSTDFPTMPSNAQVLYIFGEVRITDYCSGTGSSDPYHFAALTITPAGTPINIADLTYSPSQNKVLFQTDDGNGAMSAYGLTNTGLTGLNQWIAFNAWIDLGSSVASGYFALPGVSTQITASTPSFPSTWTFNDSPQLYLCSDSTGSNSLNCDFKNVRVVYSIPTYLTSDFASGFLASLLASYTMAQTSGYTVTGSGSLGTAYLGSSTAGVSDTDTTHMPAWEPYIDASTTKPNQDQGLSFTLATQYVSVPPFALPQELQIGSYSIGIRAWIKPSSLTADGYIFNYATSDLSTDIFGVQLLSTGKLQIKTFDQTATGTVSLTGGQWNSIVVSMEIADYLYNSGTATHFVILMVNDVYDSGSSLSVTSSQFSTINTGTVSVRIGGPSSNSMLGTMAGFEIYSPASTYLTTGGCSASTCNVDIGANTLSNSVCALPICSANCDACQNSQASGCLGCSSGYVFFQNQCQLSTALTCPTGKYRDSSYVCQNCPANCDVCSDGSTCTTCSATYLLYNSNECRTSCPATAYSDGTTCQNCPPNCDVCSDGSSCTTCSSTYLPYNHQCYSSCPVKTYSTGTACVDCPMSNCDQCTSSTCTTCSATYLLYNSNECRTSCPATTYSTGTACQNCPMSNCDQCTSSTCTTCSATYLLYNNNECRTSCPVTTYSTGTACQNCPANCDVCSDDSTCTTCSSTYLPYNHQCFASCPAKTYSTGTTCIGCSSHCSECTSNGCSVCDNGYTLNQSKSCDLIETVSASADSSDDSLSTGAIIGIVIGSLACIALVAGSIVAFKKRKTIPKYFARREAPPLHKSPKDDSA